MPDNKALFEDELAGDRQFISHVSNYTDLQSMALAAYIFLHQH